MKMRFQHVVSQVLGSGRFLISRLRLCAAQVFLKCRNLALWTQPCYPPLPANQRQSRHACRRSEKSELRTQRGRVEMAARMAPANSANRLGRGGLLKSLALSALSLVVVVWAAGGINLSRPGFKLAGEWPGYLRGNAACVANYGNYAYIGLTNSGPGGCSRGWRGMISMKSERNTAKP